jgi:hypothetical protein
MMVLFFHAARVALVAWDPCLSSRPLAEALVHAQPGELIVDGQYYAFSSVLLRQPACAASQRTRQ